MTGGLSVVGQVAVLATVNTVGGGVNRAIVSDPNRPIINTRDVVTDFVSGGAGGAVGRAGLNTYLSVTNPSRNQAARQVEALMHASARNQVHPTLNRSIVKTAIRNEQIHGHLQETARKASISGARMGTDTLFNAFFSTVSTVHSSNSGSSTGNSGGSSGSSSSSNDDLQIQPGCSSSTATSGKHKGQTIELCWSIE